MHTILLALLLAISSPKAEEQFRLGKQLVEANCAECRGYDPANLRLAVTVLRDAIRLGYSDQRAVHRLLLQAYGSLGDQPNVKREIDTILELDPDDREVRLMWIDTLPQERRLEELRAFAAKWPDVAVGHYLVAQATSGEESAKSARRWLELAGVDEQRELMAGLYAGRSEAELRGILKSDPTIYPASYALALLLIDKQGSDGFEQLRAFYRNAPAPIATAFSAAIFRQLRAAGRIAEGQRLLQEFGTKLEEGAKQH